MAPQNGDIYVDPVTGRKWVYNSTTGKYEDAGQATPQESTAAREEGRRGTPSSDGSSLAPFEYPSPVFDLQQTAQDIIDASGPLSDAQLAEQYRILPQQAQLALDLQRAYTPTVLRNELGIMNTYMPQYVDMMTNSASRERQATLNDIERMTPQVNRIDTAARGPQNQAMYDELQRQTMEGLDAGATLTPQESRDVQQAQRSAEQSRGVSGGSGSANREAVEMSLAGSSREQQRQNQASSFLALDDALRTDPFAAVGGMALPGTQMATSLVTNPGIAPPTAGQTINGQQTALQAMGANTAQAQAQYQSEQQGLAFELQRHQTAAETGIDPLTGQPYRNGTTYKPVTYTYR